MAASEQHGECVKLFVFLLFLGLYRIKALANPASGHFSEIWLSPSSAKFLTGLSDAGVAAVRSVSYR